MGHVKKRDRGKPLSIWRERESIASEEVESMVVIIDGPGCGWSRKSGCLMCGYNNEVMDAEISSKELMSQLDTMINEYNGEKYIKIYTSGSFLDPDEIPLMVQEYAVKSIYELGEDIRLLIESRPEFVKWEGLKRLKKNNMDIEIAIGLETYNDDVRNHLIRKGFGLSDYIKAGQKIIDSDMNLKTYLLQKPPFLGEKRSIDDCTNSIKKIAGLFPSTRISVNPMNVQKKTIVEKLFFSGLYRPPWLRSVMEVLYTGSIETNGSVHLMSSPTGGGKRRGAHDCGGCDQDHLRIIEEFSIYNKPEILRTKDDCCTSYWEDFCSSSIHSPIGADSNDARMELVH